MGLGALPGAIEWPEELPSRFERSRNMDLFAENGNKEPHHRA